MGREMALVHEGPQNFMQTLFYKRSIQIRIELHRLDSFIQSISHLYHFYLDSIQHIRVPLRKIVLSRLRT